jgi:DNA polymerase-3 subunit chi
MTEVVFHYGVADKLDYAARLLRKVARSGQRARVVVDPAQASALSARLWALTSTGFLAHCDDRAPAAVQVRSPVLLSQPNAAHDPERLLVVNLGSELPRGAQHCQRILDIVGTDMDDRQLGRSRKRAYDAAGCVVTMHDAGTGQETAA